ncbi:MAG: hypothetical protein QG553_589 [Patescibacteria group bacterium]|nr:hypothetical protein [Patescibacteria group bacterium]
MRRLGQKGFTLPEMLLVVAIITVITAIGTPLYLSLSNSNQLDAATSLLAQDLYQAQSYSRNRAQDSQWGVAINGQSIVLFSGASYATRDPNNDVVYAVPSGIAIGGLTQIVYSKLYGLPTSTGSFTLTGAGKTNTITVNNKGMVEY